MICFNREHRLKIVSNLLERSRPEYYPTDYGNKKGNDDTWIFTYFAVKFEQEQPVEDKE